MVFTSRQAPNLATMQFLLNGISAVTGLNTSGGVYLMGPGGNSSGPYTLIYPAGRIVDPIKVNTQGSSTADVAIARLPASVGVNAGSTLTLDNFLMNNADRCRTPIRSC